MSFLIFLLFKYSPTSVYHLLSHDIQGYRLRVIRRPRAAKSRAERSQGGQSYCIAILGVGIIKLACASIWQLWTMRGPNSSLECKVRDKWGRYRRICIRRALTLPLQSTYATPGSTSPDTGCISHKFPDDRERPSDSVHRSIEFAGGWGLCRGGDWEESFVKYLCLVLVAGGFFSCLGALGRNIPWSAPGIREFHDGVMKMLGQRPLDQSGDLESCDWKLEPPIQMPHNTNP